MRDIESIMKGRVLFGSGQEIASIDESVCCQQGLVLKPQNENL